MYPSIILATIKKAVRYFARKITKETKNTINVCLELIHFKMSSTLIYFDGEYYEYHGVEIEEQGLVIGNYMTFKVVKQLNPIGIMKIFTKPNSNLCMQES